jgi:endonuclease/exonuclease/phosphatase family metal-dependent hydrolase
MSPDWRPAILVVVAIASLGLLSCRTGRSYESPNEPRYSRTTPPVAFSGTSRDTLRVVSFNIAFARKIDDAIALLTEDPALRSADLLLLQEMDAEGTKRIADALGMAYAYYPALWHRRTRRDFGNAVLSRWPIVDDAKIRLPHVSRYAGTQRTATVATIRIGDTSIRVYSTHLGTVGDIGSSARRDQLRAIFADAATYERVIVGGDLNSAEVGRIALDLGYVWPTERVARTTRFGRWDHVFLKGLRVPNDSAAGTVLRAQGISDHHPVWALGILR